MAVSLKRALMEIPTDWPDDLPPQWRDACGEVELGFGNADLQLELGFWKPVFPVRRGRNFPGMPVCAHMLRAFEGIPPHHVRCVVPGRPPCPASDVATHDGVLLLNASLTLSRFRVYVDPHQARGLRAVARCFPARADRGAP